MTQPAAPARPVPPDAPPRRERDEVLDAGQEEVFSRTEVELGRIEHASEAGAKEPGSTPT